MGMTTIYGLIDPRNNELRYVGKTTMPVQRRYNQHVCLGPTARRTYCRNWIEQLSKETLRPELCVFEEVLDDWVEAEQFWIAYWKSLGCKLTNITVGGDTSTGIRLSSESIEKSASKRRGKKRTPEQIARIKAGLTEEGRNRLREAAAKRGFFKSGGWKLSPRVKRGPPKVKPVIAWTSAGGRPKSAEEKLKISETMKKVWASRR